MPDDYERGFAAGYQTASGGRFNEILAVNIGDSPTKVVPVKRKMKRSAWHKYMKNSKNQIKFKRGTKKGLLDMKSMARAYRRSRK